MKQAVKFLGLITISILTSYSSHAQLKLPVATGIAPDIKKVISDYPNHFVNLQGEMIIANPQSTDYECNFKVKGAEKATVTQYASSAKPIYSWQATMLTTEEFDEAKKKFKSLYTQLNNLPIAIEGAGTVHLKGQFETPLEEKKFTSVIFNLDEKDPELKKLKVEIVMLYEPMEWKVKVLVYNKEREDNEQGETEERGE